jgi:hypothetical protein
MIELTNQENKITLRKKSKRLDEVTADPDAIEKLAGYGLNEKEIASVYNVTVKQFCKAQRRNKLLLEAMERGKNVAAKLVMEALFRRATGFENREIDYTKHQGKIHASPVVKFYPPDMRAIEFWLKNRVPLKWKEKVDYDLSLKEEEFQKLSELAAEAMRRNM